MEYFIMSIFTRRRVSTPPKCGPCWICVADILALKYSCSACSAKVTRRWSWDQAIWQVTNRFQVLVEQTSVLLSAVIMACSYRISCTLEMISDIDGL